MHAHNLVRKLLLVSLCAGPAAALAEPVYSMTFLPAQFGAIGINGSGSIVGMAINNRGDIGGGWRGGAFAYSQGTLRQIGPLADWTGSFISGMNDAGQMAGNAHLQGGENARGFVYADGAIRTIPTFGGAWSSTSAINASGQVVGTSTFDSRIVNPARHAYSYQDGVMHDLGTLGGVSSEAWDLNDAGQVVGMSQAAPGDRTGAPHAFLYEHGAMRDLGLLGGARAEAHGINNAGLIVGTSEWSSVWQDTMHAFLYENAAMGDLNSRIDPAAGWELTSAQDINDAGQILATACRTGEHATVRLDRVSAVPEPRAWGLLLVGLMLVASRHRASSAALPFR